MNFAKKFQNYHDQKENYYVDENENWKHNNQEKEEGAMILYIISNLLQCRQCKLIFKSNNFFYKYFRQSSKCLRKNFQKFMTLIIIKSDRNLQKFSANIKNLQKSFANIKKFSTNILKSFANITIVIKNNIVAISSILKSFIKHFSIDLNSKLKTEYDFKKWSYAKTNIALSKIAKFRKECFDIDVDFTMINHAFFKEQTSDVHIRTMITLLIVRDLKIIRHKIDEYVIISIYIYNKDNVIEKSIRTCFIKQMHIVDDFKINIFIKNDVGEFKNISIFLNNKTAHINNCKMIVSLKVKIIEIIIDKSIHLRKTTIISFKVKLSIEIHHFAVQDRKYLFKLKKISNLTTYAHLINAFIKIILIRNEFDISI